MVSSRAELMVPPQGFQITQSAARAVVDVCDGELNRDSAGIACHCTIQLLRLVRTASTDLTVVRLRRSNGYSDGRQQAGGEYAESDHKECCISHGAPPGSEFRTKESTAPRALHTAPVPCFR